jgi:MOSC domain-containing protein YiiM
MAIQSTTGRMLSNFDGTRGMPIGPWQGLGVAFAWAVGALPSAMRSCDDATPDRRRRYRRSSVKEVELPDSYEDVQRESFRAALATILELPLAAIPEAHGESDPAGRSLSRWLGGLGLGLVPVAQARSFTWPGPWMARIRPPGLEERFVVMYGVPSGVVWDPAGDGVIEHDWIADGFVVAASDIALARPPPHDAPKTVGTLEQIWIAASAGETAISLEVVDTHAGQGLAGDRHTTGKGTFPSGPPGSALTLIEAEVCESFDPALHANEHRRNLVTRGIELNGLVGREFTIGTVLCRGMRLCEPCTVVDGYATRPVLRALVHRGGLRADILDDGELRVGDRIATSAER